MCEVQPLTAIRYATTPEDRDLSGRIAPPYDVIDQRAKDALLAGDACNFVKIDLPHMPPKAAGPPAVYAEADKATSWM